MWNVLEEELAALRIWQKVQLPGDVREGIAISIDKIERELVRQVGRQFQEDNQASGFPQPVVYEISETGDIILPEGAPFDGQSYLIKLSKGWVEAWWMKGRCYETQDGPDHEGFEWVCADDQFAAELDEAKYWMPLPETPGKE